ncbi:MAG TPA: hypothetical protein VMI52_11805 [Acetobacteraceae bacterium]|nr:hypothetical protein [Acetobacteraceae bacterium]
MGERTDLTGRPRRVRGQFPRVAATLLLLTGCAPVLRHSADPAPHPGVSPQAAAPAPARPAHIIVTLFAADPGAVRLERDALVSSTADGDADPGMIRRSVAAAVQNAVADTLVLRLRGMGLPAWHASAHAAGKGDLVIVGRILAVDGSGNGARGEVRARVKLIYTNPADGSPHLLQAYQASSTAGTLPGIELDGAQEALGLAAGVPTRRARTGAAGQGDQLADALTVEIGTFCAEKGWVPTAAVPSQSTL